MGSRFQGPPLDGGCIRAPGTRLNGWLGVTLHPLETTAVTCDPELPHRHAMDMKLPNGERAFLGNKLEDYVLNPLHRQGRHKAHVFESVLGITLADARILRDALLDAAISSEQVEPKGDNGFGSVYVLRFPINTAKGTATVLSAWIVRHGEDFPRLTTCYIV